MTVHAVVEQPRQNQSRLVEHVRDNFRRSGAHREHFYAIFLDAAQRYLGEHEIGGAQAGSMRVRLRQLFAGALASGACGLIIAHNHPSGVCKPSREDIDATKRISDIARALDIELLDHLIITESSAFSMRAGEEI